MAADVSQGSSSFGGALWASINDNSTDTTGANGQITMYFENVTANFNALAGSCVPRFPVCCQCCGCVCRFEVILACKNRRLLVVGQPCVVTA